MKRFIKTPVLIIAACTALLTACKQDSDYVKSTPGPYISNLDLKKLYKGADVVLTKEITREATVVTGQVTSDHSGGNLPSGLLFIQNLRKVSATVDSLRGIAINIGSEAANYKPGDSVKVKIEGAILTRINGILQITGVTPAQVEKVASNVKVLTTPISAATMRARPDNFEGCFGILNNANFEPNIGVETLEGAKPLNDGSGDIQMNVNSTANFKSVLLPYSAKITGIVIPSAAGVPQIWPRVKEDFFATSIVVDPAVPLGPNPAIITGYLADPEGTDANYEYIQFMATQDLDFKQRNFSVYTTNNAGASTPAGNPTLGWNTGGLRTYKFTITRGTVAKGTFFYVGGLKQIAGLGSRDISEANWVASRLYNDNNGEDGIGTKTANLLANSGNAAGVAIFATTKVEMTTEPSDVIFYNGTGGTIFENNAGYSITANDLYKTLNGNTPQPFFKQGTNTARFAAPAALQFSYLGGVYDAALKKWTAASRVHKTIPVAKQAPLSAIEKMPDVTKLIN